MRTLEQALNAVAEITQLTGPIRKVGGPLGERTGIRVAKVDRLLAEYAPEQS